MAKSIEEEHKEDQRNAKIFKRLAGKTKSKGLRERLKERSDNLHKRSHAKAVLSIADSVPKKIRKEAQEELDSTDRTGKRKK